MSIYHQDSQLTIHNGDALAVLRTMPSESAQCCVTSPPYFGLRDYGVDGQIGLEATPEAFIARLVDVFREVRRVLKDDGVLWVNIGDSYNSGTQFNHHSSGMGLNGDVRYSEGARGDWPGHRKMVAGIKAKDLIGIPWMLAFALRADGWFLRSEIIWHKPNPMPESVTDRPTKSHEQIFLLSKSAKYFYDADAIKEPATYGGDDRKGRASGEYKSMPTSLVNGIRPRTSRDSFKREDSKRVAVIPGQTVGTHRPDREESEYDLLSRNKRSVWSVATRPYAAAHFATFPPALIEPCILAGSRPAGKRCDCEEVIASPTGEGAIDDPSLTIGRAGLSRPRREGEGTRPITRRVQRGEAEQMKNSPHREAMREICGTAFDHYVRTDASGARPLPEAIRQDFLSRGWLRPLRPCDCPIEAADVVLDPFGGSGTTAEVANKFGRRAVLIELNPDYCELIMRRNCQKTIWAADETEVAA